MNSACEEAQWLAKFGSKVYLIHRRDELRASKIMAERVKNHPKIEIVWNSSVSKVVGDKTVTSIQLTNVESGQVSDLSVNGLFWAIGHVPNTQFLGGQLKVDNEGYVITSTSSD